ncbi:phage integrase Arm DNA-binding domain-containing protein [Shewanella oncorhynchi]|uniref:Phage integrase Arm DNA-binding domain-containing protein n=1 Tax=Shewanella oncorhynchi TaxID=2726434 RepID=A0AA50KBI8_9GAMM|nr:phage integrase Arm DNA-binding domain-containing protein [Shewanella oncorhynchi]WMB71386.1 phage integrase Arm DNA-binding domain-containing protein [Shewanella oncorhynchi]
MAARPRKFDLGVENLYCRQDARNGEVYYQYRDPRNGAFRGLGKDRTIAKERASALNLLIAQQLASAFIDNYNARPERVAQHGIAFKKWVEKYIAIQGDRLNNGEIRLNTFKTRKSQATIAIKAMGNIPLKDISTKDCYELMQSLRAQGKERTAQAVRSVLIDIFKEAAQAGEITGGFNPASATKSPRVNVVRDRLELEAVKQILTVAETKEPWVKNTILLALVTGQRRVDIANMQFKKGKDWERLYQNWKTGNRSKPPYSYVEGEWLHVFQQKTSTMLKLPLGLKLEALDLSIGNVVLSCRSRCVSKYLIHHQHGSRGATIGGQVFVDTITKRFSECRDELGPSTTTFHELRSLSERLYSGQGIDTQILLGHKDPRTTAAYHDIRGQMWIELVI